MRDLFGLGKGKKRSERGQALIIVVLAMIVLLAFVALAIDGGRVLTERVYAQTAADAAALSGALAKCQEQDLNAAAHAIAVTNGYDDNDDSISVSVYNPPVSGGYDSEYLEVVITSTIDNTFSQIISAPPLQNTVHAISRCRKGVQSDIPYDEQNFRALWANSSGGCEEEIYFDWSGADYIIEGGLHSNQDINIGGSNHTITGLSTVVGNIVNMDDSVTFNPELDSNTDEVLKDPFKNEYSFSRFNTGGDIYTAAGDRIVVTDQPIVSNWLTDTCMMAGEKCLNGSVLQDGIYVTTWEEQGAIVISEGGIHGDGGDEDFANVTFVTKDGGIELSGSSNKFNPYIGNINATDSTGFLQGLHGILAATWGQGANQCSDSILSTGGSEHQFYGGFLYAPNGQVELNGSTEEFTGCIIGYTIKLNGSNSTVTCDETWFPLVTYIELVE